MTSADAGAPAGMQRIVPPLVREAKPISGSPLGRGPGSDRRLCSRTERSRWSDPGVCIRVAVNAAARAGARAEFLPVGPQRALGMRFAIGTQLPVRSTGRIQVRGRLEERLVPRRRGFGLRARGAEGLGRADRAIRIGHADRRSVRSGARAHFLPVGPQLALRMRRVEGLQRPVGASRGIEAGGGRVGAVAARLRQAGAGRAGEKAQGQAGKQAFAHRLALVAAGSMCPRQGVDKKKL